MSLLASSRTHFNLWAVPHSSCEIPECNHLMVWGCRTHQIVKNIVQSHHNSLDCERILMRPVQLISVHCLEASPHRFFLTPLRLPLHCRCWGLRRRRCIERRCFCWYCRHFLGHARESGRPFCGCNIFMSETSGNQRGIYTSSHLRRVMLIKVHALQAYSTHGQPEGSPQGGCYLPVICENYVSHGFLDRPSLLATSAACFTINTADDDAHASSYSLRYVLTIKFPLHSQQVLLQVARPFV